MSSAISISRSSGVCGSVTLGRRVPPARWSFDKAQALSQGRWQSEAPSQAAEVRLNLSEALRIAKDEQLARKAVTDEYFSNFFGEVVGTRGTGQQALQKSTSSLSAMPLLAFMTRCTVAIESSTRMAWMLLQQRHTLHLKLGFLMSSQLLERSSYYQLFLYERELMYGPEWVVLEGVTRALIESDCAAQLKRKLAKWHSSFYGSHTLRRGDAGELAVLGPDHLAHFQSGPVLNFRVYHNSPRKGAEPPTCCVLGSATCRQEVMIARAPVGSEVVGQHREAPYYTTYFPASPRSGQEARNSGSASPRHTRGGPFSPTGPPIRVLSGDRSKLSAKIVFVHHHRRSTAAIEPDDDVELPEAVRGERAVRGVCQQSDGAVKPPRSPPPRTCANYNARKVADARIQYGEQHRTSAVIASSRTQREGSQPAKVPGSPTFLQRLFVRYVAPLLKLPQCDSTRTDQAGPADVGFAEWARCIGLRSVRRPRAKTSPSGAAHSRDGHHVTYEDDDEDLSSSSSPPSEGGSLHGGGSSSVPSFRSTVFPLLDMPDKPAPAKQVLRANSENLPSLLNVLAVLNLAPKSALLPDFFVMVPSNNADIEDEKRSAIVTVQDVLPLLSEDDLFWHLVSLWQLKDPRAFDATDLSSTMRRQLRVYGLEEPKFSTSFLGEQSDSSIPCSPTALGAGPQQVNCSYSCGVAVYHRIDQLAWQVATMRLQELSYPSLPLRVRGVFAASLLTSGKEHAELAAARSAPPAETERIMTRIAKAAERSRLIKLLPFLPQLVRVHYHHRQPPYSVLVPLEELDLLTDPMMLGFIKEHALLAAAPDDDVTAVHASSSRRGSNGRWSYKDPPVLTGRRMTHAQLTEAIMRSVPALETGGMLQMASAFPQRDQLSIVILEATGRADARLRKPDEEQLPLSSVVFSAVANLGTSLQEQSVSSSERSPTSPLVNDNTSPLFSSSASWFPRRFSTFGKVAETSVKSANPVLTRSGIGLSSSSNNLRTSGRSWRQDAQYQATSYSPIELLHMRILTYVSHAAQLHRRRQLSAHLGGLDCCFAVPVEMMEPYLIAESPSIHALCSRLAQERFNPSVNPTTSSMLSQEGCNQREAVGLKEHALLAAHHALPQFAQDFFKITDALLGQQRGSPDFPSQRPRSRQTATTQEEESRGVLSSPVDEIMSLMLPPPVKETGTTGAVAAAVRLAFAAAAVQKEVSSYLDRLSRATSGRSGAGIDKLEQAELADSLERARNAIIGSARKDNGGIYC